MQLEEAADAPGQIGSAARAAADLLGRHSNVEERVVLPLLGLAEAVAGGKTLPDPRHTLASLESLQAALPLLVEAETEVVCAMVELFAAGEAEGRPDISRLAERIIWHEMSDAEILYPAAFLVGSTARARTGQAVSADGPTPSAPTSEPVAR